MSKGSDDLENADCDQPYESHQGPTWNTDTKESPEYLGAAAITCEYNAEYFIQRKYLKHVVKARTAGWYLIVGQALQP